MSLEYANIAILIGIVGLMLFFLRRMDRMETGIRADMAKMESGIRADMAKMESGIRADMTKMESELRADINLKHGELRADLRDIRTGLVEVRERQARLEGIVEGMGYAPDAAASTG